MPGTGKTQFAEHIAFELGKPILMKRASEMFDKYLGESEKRIGEAFDQAEEAGAILPLTLDQRWAMFLNETGLRGKPLSDKRQEAYEERLALMKDLTPGDFATVKRQCLLLGEDLSADAWLDQLEIEIEVKAKHRAGNDEHDRSLRMA